MTSHRRHSLLLSCVLTAGCGSLAAQDIVLENLATFARKQWVDVAIPAVDAVGLPLVCRFDPQGWIAYRGRTVGQHSVLYHVLAEFGPQQRVSGSLTPIANSTAGLPPWQQTDWIADDSLAVLPLPVLRATDGSEHRLHNPKFETVESVSPARRVFRLRGRLGNTPFVSDTYLYVYAGQDNVEVESTLTCSDPRLGPDMSSEFAAIWFESGEFFEVDYRVRLGMPAPFVQASDPNHPSFGRWVQIVLGPRIIGRGEGLFLSGAMLCLPSPNIQPAPLSYGAHGMTMHWSINDRVRSLHARGDKPVVGVWRDWQDKWLAFGRVPEVPIPHRHDNGLSSANASWAGFEQMLLQPADMFAPRPRGQLKYAPSGGAQEDFGACKGAHAVTVDDPRWIYDAGYSVAQTMFRGFHYREINGAPLRQASYPTLRFFRQMIHCPSTAVTLGYPCPPLEPKGSTGWSRWDEQHRSQNNFNALLALTGRFALVDQLRDLAEVDKAMVPGFMDTPRGEGRLQMAWASMLLLMENPAERLALQQAMLQRINTVLNRWPGRQYIGNPQTPIRALGVGIAHGFFEPGTTQHVPVIVVWEHSIATMGFYAAWRVTGDTRFHDMAKEVSTLIVEHCCFQENGQWVVPSAVRYRQGKNEGRRLPASSYYTGSPDIQVMNFLQWTLPSILICRELHQGIDPARVARCDAILQDRAPNGPSDWQTAEWWAVLPR